MQSLPRKKIFSIPGHQFVPTVLEIIQLELNAKEQKGKYGNSSFETVFVFKHRDHDGVESFEEMQKCHTVAECMALSSKHTDSTR